MLLLRDYQTEAIGSIYTYFQHKSGNPLLAMPTGTGKSVVIAGFLHGIYMHYPTQRVMVLTHVKELIEQNYAKLVSLWPQAPAGVYSAGLGRRDTQHKIIFAGIASVAKRAAEFGRVDLVLIDEAHLVSPSDTTMYRTFVGALQAVNPHIKVIGFTATPWRLGHGHIAQDGLFTDVCFDITTPAAFNRLIAEGYLSMLVPRSTKAQLDTAGVHTRGGEFVASELQAAVDRNAVTEKALEEIWQHAEGRHHWLTFCAGVEHAVHVAEAMTHHGVRTVAIHSKMTDKERDRAIAAWKAGEYTCATNNNVLTTGIDFPGIDLINVLRPTMSSVLWVQMLGRGTRPVYAPGYDLNTIEGRNAAIDAGPKHDCLVMDFANNTKRLGPINDPVLPRRKGEAHGEAPVKLCEACGTWNHASARVCIGCAAEFKFTVKLKQTASDQALVKLDMPVVEVFAVEHVTVQLHEKLGSPPSLKVQYHCTGLRMFTEWVAFEHPQGKGRAAMWWRRRCKEPVPATTLEALQASDQLQPVTHLRVWVNKRYPEILDYCFDGSSFGSQPPSGYAPDLHKYEPPRYMAPAPAAAPVATPGFDDFDADIPF